MGSYRNNTNICVSREIIPFFVISLLKSFHLQMIISIPFLRANYLRTYLLIMRTRFFSLLYVGGTYKRLVFTCYKNIFYMIAVLILFYAGNRKK